MIIRKILICVGIILLLLWGFAPHQTRAQSGDKEFDLALEWMHDLGMTRYNDYASFDMRSWITREQGAKFFSQFAQNALEREVTQSNDCDFNDMSGVDTTLATDVVDACQLGLFKGSKGSFLPKQPLTKAQAITVLMRAVEGGQIEEGVSPRWKNYYDRARWLGLTKELDVWGLDKPVTRYEVALLLYRAVHGSIDPDLIDLQELEELLLELGLLKS